MWQGQSVISHSISLGLSVYLISCPYVVPVLPHFLFHQPVPVNPIIIPVSILSDGCGRYGSKAYPKCVCCSAAKEGGCCHLLLGWEKAQGQPSRFACSRETRSTRTVRIRLIHSTRHEMSFLFCPVLYLVLYASANAKTTNNLLIWPDTSKPIWKRKS